jgi:hypothetical protein
MNFKKYDREDFDPVSECSPLDMRMTSSPENTYALLALADYRTGQYPKSALSYMEKIFSLHSNHVNVIVDQNATKDNFLKLFEEGCKWPFFMFYEFAHGYTRMFRMTDAYVYASDIYAILKTSQSRILGFFDSCYSGSMIDADELMRARKPEDETGIDCTSIASYLTSMMHRDQMMLKSSSESAPAPVMKLCASSADQKVCTYNPYSDTSYTNAIYRAWNKTKDMRYKDFDEHLLKYGSYGPTDPAHVNHVVPQFSTFGPDFSSSLAFT